MSVVPRSRRRKPLSKQGQLDKVKIPKLCAHHNGQAFIPYKNQCYYTGPIGSEKAAHAYQDAIEQIRLGCVRGSTYFAGVVLL